MTLAVVTDKVTVVLCQFTLYKGGGGRAGVVSEAFGLVMSRQRSTTRGRCILGWPAMAGHVLAAASPFKFVVA